MTENFSLTVQGIQNQLDASPFISFLRLRCTAIDVKSGTIEMTMPFRPEVGRGADARQFHGGAVASLIDTVGDFAVVMVTGGSVPTINLRVDFLRPSTGAILTGKASIRRVGRTLGVIDIDVLDENGKLTAVGRGCYGVPAS